MLRDDCPEVVLKCLHLSRRRRGKDSVREALMPLENYITRPAERMNYPELIRLGYLVDSGRIENACKNVIQARLKGSDMRWSRKGAKAVLEIRTALMSDIWEEIIRQAA